MKEHLKNNPTLKTHRTLSLLLSGKGFQAKRLAGKQVLVIDEEVLELKKGDAGWRDFQRLQEKYGRKPIVAFVPRQDISYILIVCS